MPRPIKITRVTVTRYGWDPGWTIYFGVILAFVVGCLVALPALRLQGVYLALVAVTNVLFTIPPRTSAVGVTSTRNSIDSPG